MRRAWHQNFRRKPTKHAGRSFDSQGEANFFDVLKEQEQAGEIRDIKTQQTILIVATPIKMIRLRVDFTVFDLKLQETVFVEYKGFETDEWIMKKALWSVFGPGRLRVYKANWGKITLEEIIPTGYPYTTRV